MISIDDVFLSTQITAVKILDNVVFIGEGQYLHIHLLTTGEKLTSVRVFKAAVIHNLQIRVFPDNPTDIWRVLVCGQKSFAIVNFNTSNQICCVDVEEKQIEDWIVDATFEEEENLLHIVVATAHNKLLRIKLPTKEHLTNERLNDYVEHNDPLHGCELSTKEQCSENCILYCGRIVIDSGGWKDAVLLAGTVFSQVLIWGPWGDKDQLGRILPSICLTGHQGVLFSINYCPVNSVITTTSDDRSMRVWGIQKYPQTADDRMGSIGNCNHWKNFRITEKHKFFGHGSRVWRSLILPSHFVSVGEDSKVCVWGYDGVLLTSWKAHDGSCIWGVAANEDGSKLVTGGGDGSVKSWCLKLHDQEHPEVILDIPWIKNDTKLDYEEVSNTSVQSGEQSNDTKADSEQVFGDTENVPGKLSSNPSLSNGKIDAVTESYDNLSLGNEVDLPSVELFKSDETSIVKKGIKDKKNSLMKEDFPRCVSLLGLNTYLVLMDSGNLYSWKRQISKWFLAFNDVRLKSYAVMEACPNNEILAIGTLCGHLLLLGPDADNEYFKVIVDEQVMAGKVFAVYWLSSGSKLLTCGNEGLMITWNFDLRSKRLLKDNTYILPKCKQRWVSAVCLYSTCGKNYLICGDRAGSIHLYARDKSEVLNSLRSIHGKNGVTSLTNSDGYIYSTGRDGCVRHLVVQDNLLQVLTVTRVTSANWVASLKNIYGRQLAVCFHDIKLKLWSLDEDRAVVEVECGGGHRSWALNSSEDEDKLALIYIKDTKPYVFTTTLKDKLMPLIKTPVNTRETVCLEVLFETTKGTVFTTGGEDTTLRVHTLLDDKLNTLNVIRSHISNVRTMCRIEDVNERLPKDSKRETVWIVSAGGRAQLKIWKSTLNLEIDNEGMNRTSNNITCQEVTSHMLRTGSNKTWRSQEMTFDPETRYMDVTAFWVSRTQSVIVLASSDGFLRFFEFDRETETIRMVCSEAWHHCLLKVEIIHFDHLSILVSAATDGILAFWDIQSLIEWIRQEETNQKPGINRLASITAHQSGINSIAIGFKKETTLANSRSCQFLVATGGDDNKMGVRKITIDIPDTGVISVSNRNISDVYGHASQITGLAWLTEKYLVSTSVDQRVIVWALNESNETPNEQHCDKDKLTGDDVSLPCKLTPVCSQFSGVPDVKGLTTVTVKSSPCSNQIVKRIFVYGIGMQVYDVKIDIT